MSLHRRAARKDESAREIIDALEALGVFVVVLSGEGVPDLLCGWQGEWMPLELKSEGGLVLDKRNGRTYRGADGKLTPAQDRFIREAARHGLPVPVAKNITEAIDAVCGGILTGRKK